MNEFPQQQKTFFLSGTVGQLEVVTTWPKTNAKNRVGIICHPHPLYQGSLKNKVVTTIAQAFDILGLKTVRFNFRGVEKSVGKYGETIGETQDLLSILQWTKKVLPTHEIYLAGFSFGAYIAANVANQEAGIKQLITIAPAITHHDFQSLDQIACPWLMIQGDADEITSFAAVKNFVEHNAQKIVFRVLHGASHFFHGRLSELKEILINELTLNKNQ